jgi:hypothetical protein
MNAPITGVFSARTRLQHFITQQLANTPRHVIDTSVPHSTWLPTYVAHRDVTPRQVGAK